MTVQFEYNYNSHVFKTPGYLTCKVPDVVREELQEIIDDIKKNREKYKDLRYSLAGHLDQEYQLPITPNIKYLAETLSIEYDNLFNGGLPYSHVRNQYREKNEDEDFRFKYELDSLWINFSKKYDFNPSHIHSGSYSFVIWVEIPYDLEKELSRYSPNGVETSLFSFTYIDTLGTISRLKLKIDKSWEWKMAFFPASLHHSVNPFYTSDEYRISIAGNVHCSPVYSS